MLDNVLEVEPGPDRNIRFRRATGPAVTLELQPLGVSPDAPVLDGVVAAVWPLLLRAGGRLRVAGSLSRSALRNFTEMGEAWANWRPRDFHVVTLAPDHVVDLAAPSTGSQAAVAWSGSLRSTHTLIRQCTGGAIRPFKVTGVVRVWGLHPAERDVNPDSALEPARQALADLGLTLTIVTTRAAEQSLLDPAFGDLPWVAAALHRLGALYPVGLHARPYTWASQLNYPRPEPALPDLWSGDAVNIRADGGAASSVQMLHDVAAYPALLKLVSNCRRHPRHAPACGRCSGCRWLHLARVAAGQEPVRRVRDWVRLPQLDARGAAEAQALHREWRGDRNSARALLAKRIALHDQVQKHMGTLRWLRAAAGVGRTWPR